MNAAHPEFTTPRPTWTAPLILTAPNLDDGLATWIAEQLGVRG